jgi:hypothetical protein
MYTEVLSKTYGHTGAVESFEGLGTQANGNGAQVVVKLKCLLVLGTTQHEHRSHGAGGVAGNIVQSVGDALWRGKRGGERQ